MSETAGRDTGLTMPRDAVRWKLPLALFALTVASTFYVGATNYVDDALPPGARGLVAPRSMFEAIARNTAWLARGWSYAVPLLTILLCHEFGHYVMARRHGVPASLPMFIPVPFPPFGTMGAVIKMRDRIRARDALLDIGAAGPLAGLIVALPITFVGLLLSPVRAIVRRGVQTQEGTSVLYAVLKAFAKGSIPPDHDVFLHPVAMAGWVGMFVTMINLIPYGQLDGGHVAYSLAPSAHDRFARYVPWLLAALALGTSLYAGHALVADHRPAWNFGTGYTQGFNWIAFAVLIWLMHRGTRGLHPPTDGGSLGVGRRIVAVFTLLLFVALFMPVPLRIDEFPP